MSRLSFSRRIALIFCLPFLAVSCQKPQRPPVDLAERNFPERIPAPRQAEENLPSEQTPLPEPPELDPDIWDVSSVDISAVDKTKKLISFTFDDAPLRTLENILAVFAAFNEQNPDCPASATVFFNGYLFDAHSTQTVHAAHALGFELGNHSQSHLDLTTLDEATLREELDKTDALLAKIDGKPKHLFRAPFGRANELVSQSVCTPVISWTIDTLDWTGLGEEDIYRSVWDGRFDGAIALMHDGYTNTVSALKRLLPDLKADGYQVVSVSQLAKAQGQTLRRGKTYGRIRKPNHAKTN